MAIPLRLQIYKGDTFVETRDFDREMIKIGRLASAHLYIDDEKVSRIHAVINVESADQISIVDMGSIEGTFLNGKRVNKGQLRFGDEVRVGGTRILIEDGSAPQQVAVTPEGMAPAASIASLAAPGEAAEAGMPQVGFMPAEQSSMAIVPAVSQQVAMSSQTSVPPGGISQTFVQPTPGVTVEAPQGAFMSAVGRVPPQVMGGPLEQTEGELETRQVGRFVPKEFGTYVPAPPAPRRPRERTARLGLHIRYYWGDSLLHSVQMGKPRPVYVGDSRRSEFKLEREQLGLTKASWEFDPRFGGKSRLRWRRVYEHLLVAPGGDGFALQLGPKMMGILDREGSAGPQELQPDSICALNETDFAWVDMGAGIRAEFSFEEQPRPIVVPFFQNFDYRFINLILLLAFLVGAFMVTASTHTEADIIADDIGEKQLKMVKAYIQEAEKPQKNPLLEKLNKKEEQPQAGEQAERHKNDEGKMGKKDIPENKTKRSAPKAIDINAKDLVKTSGGLVSVLGGGGGGGLATIFGQGGLGGDIKGAIGNMHGPQVGDAGGFGGLGLRGTGTGGGGSGNTIGVGDIGTKGRGGGMGGYGAGLGNLGGKKKSEVMISDGESTIQGSLDKELIRQVIHRNMNQIRYCYEKELQKKPDLAGKLVIRFEIAPKGNVPNAKLHAGSTLKDDALSECITIRIRNWRFPEPKGGGKVIVIYPFVFKSAGD